MKPRAPQGFAVSAFASGLDHPRWLYVLPNGDVLVADDVGNIVWRVAPAAGQPK
jgi:glucose/arabinose dehydrogenase